MDPLRNAERERFGLYRLCECPECGGTGKTWVRPGDADSGDVNGVTRCPECRGEGRIRQEVVSAPNEAGVGLALVTCGREGEWEGCAFGLLDRLPDCPECERRGCPVCKGTGIKETGTWIVLPWLPSARNVTDAARTLARSKKTVQEQ